MPLIYLLGIAFGAGATAPTTTTTATRPASGFVTDIFSCGQSERPQIDLNGRWQFRRDPNDLGKRQGWHEGRGEWTQTVVVPGAPQAQGIGQPHPRQKTFFLEPFWVRRTFRLPELTERQRVWLRIGGILPAGEIYLNGVHVGTTQSSRTQQRVDVSRMAHPGKNNLLAIKVCDFPPVRLDGIWEMAECSKNWTGVYRPISCEITDRVSVVDMYIRPRLSDKTVRVDVELTEAPAETLRAAFRVGSPRRTIGEASVDVPAGKRTVTAEIPLDAYRPWSPASPVLYDLHLSLQRGSEGTVLDSASVRFGMREIRTEGTRFLLNGSPVFIRAFGDDQFYPDTLCPPADKAWYLARLKRARQYGMNAVKGCVETIPQEYIEAADEAGILVIQEMPFGLSDLRANRYTIDARFRDYYSRELDGLVRQSRNHASVVAYSMSSELEFSNQTADSFNFFSRDLVRQTRQLAPHALVIDCTGYLDTEDTPKGKRDTDFYASIIPTWMKEVLDETPIKTDRRHPTILHEYNWWSCYPDPDDKDRYLQSQLKPFWLDTLVKTARDNGQEGLIPTYRRNSLWLQALCRKDGIEYARRNPDVQGFILWLLIDFGQYCEGLFDDFWEPKNVSAEEFLKSNGDTVILLAQEGNRSLKMGDRIRTPLAVSHYASSPLRHGMLRWRVQRDVTSQGGTLRVPELQPGELTQAGTAEWIAPEAPLPYRCTLEVSLHQSDRLINTNEWSFWVFPEAGDVWREPESPNAAGRMHPPGFFSRLGPARTAAIPDEATCVLADAVDEPLANYIERGGRCLLLTRGAAIENTAVYYGTTSFYRTFRTIPWNAGTSGNSGSVIRPHPALKRFPHEGMCDLPFLRMIRGSLPMEVSPLRPFGVEPIIRMIDHYAANRNNAHLIEFAVGKGKVLVTSLGILPAVGGHIEARYLLKCLVEYAHGNRFEPEARVPKQEFLRLFRPPAKGRG